MDKMKEQAEEKEMERTRLRTVANIVAKGAIRLYEKKKVKVVEGSASKSNIDRR